MDALELLIADHNRVRGLFARFRSAEEGQDTATMAAVATRIIDELEVHTRIEEEIFYPAITGNAEVHDVVTEGIEEHHVADQLMAEIKQLEAGHEKWVAKVKVLIESVEHHAEEEETEMFPVVRKRFAESVRARLGQSLESRKAQLGAPTAADKEHLTTEQLKALAREQEIPGRSSMKRDELVATVAPE